MVWISCVDNLKPTTDEQIQRHLPDRYRTSNPWSVMSQMEGGFGTNLTWVWIPVHALIGWEDINTALTLVSLSFCIYKMGTTRFSSHFLEWKEMISMWCTLFIIDTCQTVTAKAVLTALVSFLWAPMATNTVRVMKEWVWLREWCCHYTTWA